MPSLIKTTLVIALCAANVGCAKRFIHKQTEFGSHKILSVDAQQRLVLEGKSKKGNTIICSEPSPDAIVAQAASLGSALNATIPGATEAQKTTVGGALAAGSAEAAASIGLRTQSIQLMRDGYYRLCEALMNDQIGEDEYQATVANIDMFILSMLAIEQLGDKAFAANNVSIGASANGDASPGEEGKPASVVSNADAETNLPDKNSSNVTSIKIDAASLNGEVALHKSRGIVEVLKEYRAWKEHYFKINGLGNWSG